MKLSLARKQNYLYALYVILTATCFLFLYPLIHQNWILFREGERAFQNKNYKEAITFYQKSIALNVPTPKAVLNLANSYVALGEFEKAIVYYQDYLQLRPQDDRVRLSFAKTLSWLKRFEESEEEYKKILDSSHVEKN